MENKSEELRKLKKRNEELKPIVLKSFKTEKELDKYSKSIQKEIDEYYDNLEKIKQLEWELMTPEEQEKEKEVLRLMKEKREGKMH